MLTFVPMLKSDAIKRAAEESGATAGGVSRLAEIFEITRSAVSQWPDGPLPQPRIYELMAKRPAWFATSAAEAAGAASTVCTEVAA